MNLSDHHWWWPRALTQAEIDAANFAKAASIWTMFVSGLPTTDHPLGLE